jgi:excisionase family DNA binding protein
MTPKTTLTALIERELALAVERIAEAIDRQGVVLATKDIRQEEVHVGSKLLLNAVEAADYLGCSECTVRVLWREGGLPFVRIGRGRKVTRQMLDEYVAHRTEDR